MDVLEPLFSNQAFFIAFVALAGLIVGSFLNVVIYRLPIMLEAAWRRECEEFLDLSSGDGTETPTFNLIFPRSQCPHCKHLICAHENIPVISYAILGGKCSHCKEKISPRYPLIELSAAIVSATVAWQLGPSWQAAMGLLLSWSLICLAAIDVDRQLLPDSITLPMIWLGLIVSLFDIFTDSRSSIIGAVAGYSSLWIVFHVFKLLTGKEGMGYGDFKLLSAFGAWLGWQSLLLIVLLSSLVGAVFGILMVVLLKRDRSVPIPFGPYLAIAGWIALLWGKEITSAYLQMSGIR